MPNKAELVNTARRRRFVFEKRKSGLTARETAEQTVEHFGEDDLPDGWGPRYVSKDMSRVLEKVREEVQEIAADYRDIEISRYEELLSSLWPYAFEHTEEVVTEHGQKIEVERPPDEKKIDRILAIMDRLERLYDIDEAPPMHGRDSDGDTNIFVQVNQEIES